MENTEIILETINTLSNPILLVKENADVYERIYSNISMDKLLPKDDKNNSIVDENILKFIKQFIEEESDYHTINNALLFHNSYNIIFNKNDNGILILFIQNKDKESSLNFILDDVSAASNALMVILDLNGYVVDVNKCFCEMVGMEYEEVIEKSFFETFMPNNVEQLSERLGDIMSKETHNKHFVTPLKAKDGTSYRINWQVSKIEKQNQTYIIAVGGDVSILVEENNTLKHEIKSINIGFEYFPFSVGYMNVNSEFTKVNPRFAKMFHLNKDDKNIKFDDIDFFKKNIGFKKLNENIQLIKEMSYSIDTIMHENNVRLKVNIRMLSGKKEDSKFYIVIVQRV